MIATDTIDPNSQSEVDVEWHPNLSEITSTIWNNDEHIHKDVYLFTNVTEKAEQDWQIILVGVVVGVCFHVLNVYISSSTTAKINKMKIKSRPAVRVDRRKGIRHRRGYICPR
jgi:hypothetical protein